MSSSFFFRPAGPRPGGVFFTVALALALACGPTREEPSKPITPATGAPDLVLVTVDTLRADATGFSGNGRVETPVLDRLAQEGRVYPNAHAHNTVTLPSHVNIFTGRLPFDHGVRDNGSFALSDDVPTLAGLLRAAGYATGAFVAAFPLDARFGLDTGFDVYDDRYHEAEAAGELATPERPATEVVAAARRWYESHVGSPRFLWVHLFEPHAPYEPRPPFDRRYRDAPYLGEVASADAALAELMEPLWQGTPRAVVIVTSDHGESLGAHGELTHGLFAYEETLTVPLVVWGPGRVAPGVDPLPARHVDVLPTVLALASLAAPDGLPGQSLLVPREAEPVTYFESMSASYNYGWAPLRGVIRGSHKLIELPLAELYDLATDPTESANLIDREPRLARQLRTHLPAPTAKVERRGLSELERRRLASLGYLSGSAPEKESYGPADDPKRLVHLDRKLQEVVRLYSQGELAEAAALARQVIAARPETEIAHRYLGFILHQQNDLAAASAAMRVAIDLGLESGPILRRLALTLTESGRAEEAVTLLADRAAASRDPRLLNTYAMALAEAGRLEKANRALDRALELDRTFGLAYQNQGIVALKAGDIDRAKGLLERALEIDPRLPIAWNVLGVVRSRHADDEGALAAWRRALEIDPGQYDALYNFAVVALRLGRTAEARRALDRFVASAPADRYQADLVKARRWLRRLDAKSTGASAGG